MKTKIFIFKSIITLLVLIGQGCSNQLDDSYSENKEEEIESQPFSSSCSGHGECLPFLTINPNPHFSSMPGTTISWGTHEGWDGCRLYTLELKGKKVYGTYTINNSGDIVLYHNI